VQCILKLVNFRFMIKLLFIIAFLMSLGFTTNAQIERTKLLDVWHDTELNFWYGDVVYNEVWGFVHNGEEYGVIGHKLGTTVCKITADDKLAHIQTFRGSAIEEWTVIHRDYHDYNGYLYEVCDQSTSTLRIYDLQYLPDSLHIVYDSDDLILRCHNIFIDSSSALLYACGMTDGIESYAMRVYSLADPINPQLVYTYPFVDYVHDCYVRNDTAYLNCAFQGLRVVNFANPTMPMPLGSLQFYPDLGYNHSGWLSEDGKTYVMCDETSGARFKVLDVSNLSSIEVKSFTKPPTFNETMPHNVMLKDGLAYFSYYNDGLQIYDVRNPAAPKRIAYYDTYNGDDGPTELFNGAWGVYTFLPSKRLLVSDRSFGLHLIKYDAPPRIEPESDDVYIYPNPVVNGEAYFYLNHRSSYTYQFSLFDDRGRLVKSLEDNTDYLYLDLTTLSSGVYVYRYYASESDKVITGKFIVAHQ
jgi:choice-of-anchor B domain-containing protein